MGKHSEGRLDTLAIVLFLPLLCSLCFCATAHADDNEDVPASVSIGLDPRAVKTSDMIAAEEPGTLQISSSTSDWNPAFHGYLRAPMSIGFQEVDVTNGPAGEEVVGKDTIVNAPPRIPDGSYSDWQYTSNIPGPWAELRFAYGNSRVTGNVSIAAYTLTDAGYRNLQAQLGIDQAFVTLEFPDLFGGIGGIMWNVGAFQNRYGGTGRYDAGKYDTYIFGRTHTGGERLTANFNITDHIVLEVEHGFGVKLDTVPAFELPTGALPGWMPYGGEVQQGTGLVNHAHLGFALTDFGIFDQLLFAGHFLQGWTNDADASTLHDDIETNDQRDAKLRIFGGEIKWHGGVLGEGFIGYSRIDAQNLIRMPNAIEVIHSFEGWNLMQNYFNKDSSGVGTIDTFAFQYTFSFASALWYPQKFWGQGPDLLLSGFGMLNVVDSKDKDEFPVPEKKFKWGAEATYLPFGWLGLSMRYDQVKPDLDEDKTNFQILSPRILIRTQFVTREQITLQYTHYIAGDQVTAVYPYYQEAIDKDVIMIMANMWW